MSDTPLLPRITATPAADEAISRLLADRGGPVMFVQSGGCCAGSTPMCFPAHASPACTTGVRSVKSVRCVRLGKTARVKTTLVAATVT